MDGYIKSTKQWRIILINVLWLIIFISRICYGMDYIQSHHLAENPLSANLILQGGIAATATGDTACFNGSSDLLLFSINGNVAASLGYIPSTTPSNITVSVSPGTYTISDQPFNVPGGTCQLSQSQSVTIQNNTYTPVSLSYHFTSSTPGGGGITATATGDAACLGGNDTLVFSVNGSVAASVFYTPSTTSTNVTVNVSPGTYSISDQPFNVSGGTCQLSQSPSVTIQNNTYTPVSLSYHFTSSSPGGSGIAATATGDTACFNGSSDLLLFSINGNVAASLGYIPSTTSKNIAINVSPGIYTISDQPFNVPGGTCQLSQSQSVTIQNNTYTPVSLAYHFTSSTPGGGGIAATATGDAECLGGNDTLVFSVNGSVAGSVSYTPSTTSTNMTVNVPPGTYTISDQPFNVSGGTCQLSQSPSVTIQNNTYTPVSLSYHFTSSPPSGSGIAATATGDTECLGGNDTLVFSVNGSAAASVPYTPSTTSTNVNVSPGTYTISDQPFNVSGGTCQLSQSKSVTIQNNTYTPVSLSYHFTSSTPGGSGITVASAGDAACAGGNDTLIFSVSGSVAASVPYTPSCSPTNVTVNVSPGTYTISDQPFNVSGGTCQLSQSPSVTIQNNSYTPINLSYRFSPSL